MQQQRSSNLELPGTTENKTIQINNPICNNDTEVTWIYLPLTGTILDRCCWETRTHQQKVSGLEQCSTTEYKTIKMTYAVCNDDTKKNQTNKTGQKRIDKTVM